MTDPARQKNAALEALLASLRQSGPAAPTIEGRRAAFDATAAAYLPLPPGTEVSEVDVDGIASEWVRSNLSPPALDKSAVLYLHGGGFSFGSPTSHREFVARIAASCRLPVLSLGYRLAPEHPFPAGLEDVISAYRWLLRQGFRADRIVIAGDSAGGGLAASALVVLRDRSLALPAAGVMISPWVDLTLSAGSLDRNVGTDPLVKRPSGPETVARYIGPHGNPRDPLVSPLFADLHGLPPLLILAGLSECFLDDSLRFAARARRAGVDATLDAWEDMPHIWPFFAKVLPEGRAAIDDIGKYIRRKLGTT